MGFRDRLADVVRGPRQGKASLTAPAILSTGPFQAKWMSSDFESWVREGYQGNSYVYACIRQIAMAVAGIPWRAYTKSDKKKELDNHPILDLIHRPNPLMGQGRFFENWVGYLHLDGNIYVEAAGGSQSGNGGPDELWPLRPDRMRIIPGNTTNLVAGYIYRIGGVEIPFPEPKILHQKFWNPTNDWYGQSPMQAASKPVDQSNQSKAWNLSLLQNGARPSGALMTPPQLTVEDMQYQRLKEWIEEQHAGYMNAGRVAILEGGLTWTAMGLSPDDMSWIEGQKLTAREIAMVYNIAPELIGDPESKTFSNYKEARKALYEENILPLMDWMRDDLNNWLTPRYQDAPYLDYDRDEIEALQEDRTAVYERNNAAFTSGWMTINDAREAASMDKDPVMGDFYKWQLPVAAVFNPATGIYELFDPEAEPVETNQLPSYNPTGAALPYPNLPPTHPLNAGPPNLLPPGQTPPALPPGKPAAGAGQPGQTPPAGAGMNGAGGEKRRVILPFPVRRGA